MTPTLLIGNKNYSSWSMRPWVLMTQLGLPFIERKLRFDFTPGSDFYRQVRAVNPTGQVPVLVLPDGFAVWDTLAIAEALHELHPQAGVWPADARARMRARSLAAEMHSGFGALRRHCPMNIEARLPEVGAKVLAEQPEVAAQLARLQAMWSEAVAVSGGPFLFGERFGAVDAMYAPVVMRIGTYGLPLDGAAARYAEALAQSSGVQRWVADALAEQDFLDFEEPYRTAR